LKSIKFRALAREIRFRFKGDDIPALAAQLTYHLILAFFPFLIFLITLVACTPITKDDVLSALYHILPSNTYKIVFDLIQQSVPSRSSTLLPIGMITALWVASGGVTALIRGLNKAYDEEEKRSFWKLKGISALFTIGLVLAILISISMLVFGKMLGEYVFNYLGVTNLFGAAWNIIRYIITLAFLTLIFIFLYRYLPHRQLNLKETLPGSIFSTVGWILVSSAFSFYVNNFGSFANMYGNIGGIILLLLWLYWINIIILLGGEINAALTTSKNRT
jgi:membrane protein